MARVESSPRVVEQCASTCCTVVPQGSFRKNSGGLTPLNSPRSMVASMTQAIREELKCSICLDGYKLPTTLPCGHTFCRYCVLRGYRSGDVCPMCRLPMGKVLSTNMVILNLTRMALLPSGRSTKEVCYRRNSVEDRIAEATRDYITPHWWDFTIGKAYCPLVVILRLLGQEIRRLHDDVFSNDFAACAYDFLTRHEAWYPCYHLVDCAGASKLSNDIGLIVAAKTSDNAEYIEQLATKVKAINADKLQAWLEKRVEANLHLIAKNSNLNPQFPDIVFRTVPDKPHRIEADYIRGIKMQAKLPWSGGRHPSNHIHIAQSSVSFFHFLLVELPGDEDEAGEDPSNFGAQQMGLMDLGSLVGTMIRLDRETDLQSGWILHLADRVELQFRTLNLQESFYFYWGDSNGANRQNSNAPQLSGASTSSSDSLDETPTVRRNWKTRRMEVWDTAAARVAIVSIDSALAVNSVTGALDWVHPDTRYRPIPLAVVELSNQSVNEDEDNGETRRTSTKADKAWFVDPSGSVLGRGPTLRVPGCSKIPVTGSNGYVSREHCHIFYGLHADSTPGWRLRDLSSLGTFRRIQPFEETIVLKPGRTFKVGQCKIEIAKDAGFVLASAYAPPDTGSPGQPTRAGQPPAIHLQTPQRAQFLGIDTYRGDGEQMARELSTRDAQELASGGGGGAVAIPPIRLQGMSTALYEMPADVLPPSDLPGHIGRRGEQIRSTGRGTEQPSSAQTDRGGGESIPTRVPRAYSTRAAGRFQPRALVTARRLEEEGRPVSRHSLSSPPRGARLSSSQTRNQSLSIYAVQSARRPY